MVQNQVGLRNYRYCLITAFKIKYVLILLLHKELSSANNAQKNREFAGNYYSIFNH